jgi:Rrf2 family protein
MLDIALFGKNHPVTLKDLAERQEISAKYLEQLMIPLRTAGLVRSVRGPEGGYQLARLPADISLGEIIHLLEGPLTLVDCVNDPRFCSRRNHCVTVDIWKEIGEEVKRILERYTLEDLARLQKKKAPQELLVPGRESKRNKIRKTRQMVGLRRTRGR